MGEADGDEVGRHLSAGGDINGDGIGDLALSSPGASALADEGGVIYLIYGGVEGERSLADADASVAVGDLDGDGALDVAVGAPYASAYMVGSGVVYGLLGGF